MCVKCNGQSNKCDGQHYATKPEGLLPFLALSGEQISVTTELKTYKMRPIDRYRGEWKAQNRYPTYNKHEHNFSPLSPANITGVTKKPVSGTYS